MATFYYRAVTAAGRWQQGSKEGWSEKNVAQELQAMGLVPVYVGLSPEASTASVGGWLGTALGSGTSLSQRSLGLPFGARRVSGRDRLLFTQEMATLLSAGVPLDRALSICSELTESKVFREIIADVLRQVRAGKSLADALEAQGKVFSKLYVNMVRAGQASGSLHVVFQRLAELEEATAEWRSHLISSLIYPALLIVAAAASLALLMNFLVPRFAPIF